MSNTQFSGFDAENVAVNDEATEEQATRQADDGLDESSAIAAANEAVTAEADDEDQDEGDIAADYIEELLDICDIDGDIDIDENSERTYISVNASGDSNLGLLSKTETVSALQELTRLTVQNRTGAFSRLILDIGGSRDARRVELTELVDRAIARIEAGASSAALPSMSSYERKIVHDVVAERGYASMSEGEGRDRHTVITSTS